MRIAIMAAGAVGGYFGARLAAAGEDVRFVARGKHLQAIRRRGLRIESPLGDLHLDDVEATDDPARIGAVDAVLFAVKLWDTETAGAACRKLIGPDTAVIDVQNGIDGYELLAPILGSGHAVGGVAYIGAVIAEPGVIRHSVDFARLAFGESDGGPSARLDAFQAACAGAGIDAFQSAEIERERWQKFVLLVGLSGATALTRHPIGPILEDDETRALFVALMAETVAVARAKGIALAAEYAADRLEFARSLPATMRASMLDDLERGNRLELDWLSGAVVRLGRALEIPTPANAAVYAGLRLHAGGGAHMNRT